MDIRRWFGLSVDEEKALERLCLRELRAMRRLSRNATAKQGFLAPIKSVRWQLPETTRQVEKIFSSMQEDSLSVRKLLKLERAMKRCMERDEVASAVLSRIRKEFRQDTLWQRLFAELETQQRILKKGLTDENLAQLKQSVAEEHYLLSLVEKITSSEHAELHAHVCNTVPLPHTFGLVKKMVLERREELERRIAEFEKKGLHPEDAQVWRRIIECLSRGRTREARSLFERLVEVTADEHHEFEGFMRKDTTLRPLWPEIHGSQDGRGDSESGVLSIVESLRAIADDYHEQGITYLELRFPPSTMLLKALAATREYCAAKSIIITQIIFQAPSDPPETNIERWVAWAQEMRSDPQLAEHFHRYVVGVDYTGFYENPHRDFGADVRRLRAIGLPITMHIGEIFDGWRKLPAHERYVRFATVLRHIEESVDAGVSRLGHASIMGVDIASFFTIDEILQLRHAGQDVDDLARLQDRVAALIKEHGVVIECNPTSNMRIMDLDEMAKHPAAKMLRQYGLKITVSTDDRAQFNTHLQKELFELAYALRLKQDELDKLIKQAHESRLDRVRPQTSAVAAD